MKQLAKLEELFGSYKAEWLDEKIFHFFAEPSYFNALKSRRPCVLMGGRGTGKTTVLRGLSYQGQYALCNRDIQCFDSNDFIGVYFRCDTNHVRAFEGSGLLMDQWNKIFAHYFNLIITTEIIQFVMWHHLNNSNDQVLSKDACNLIAMSLHVEGEVNTIEELYKNLEQAKYLFQANINCLDAENIPPLSLLGDPIKIVTEQLTDLLQFRGKIFYLLIDEYENLTDSQQQLLNTLLKHASSTYTLKIGVREMGWRIKYTLNPLELVNDPADYVLFNIARLFTEEIEDQFIKFAKSVCQLRINELFERPQNNYDIENYLSNLSIEEEAIKLGVEQHDYYLEVSNYIKQEHLNIDIPALYLFFIGYWAHNHHDSIKNMILHYKSNLHLWNTRYDNYKYSMLFKIRTGRGGGVQKYYSGWDTFVKLASGNIRYLMELVYKSYYLHIQEGGDITDVISIETQTKAAREVGYKNLVELEGYWKSGAKLTRMTQTIGTIFSKIAKDGYNIAPELVQFEIDGIISQRTEEILNAGVMNLALLRLPTNKQSGIGSVKEFMYMLHPIFAPYFIYGYRKKRKLQISEEEFLLCVDNPKEAVYSILSRRKIINDMESSQLLLSFFDDDK